MNSKLKAQRLWAVRCSAWLGIREWSLLIIFLAGSFWGWMASALCHYIEDILAEREVIRHAVICPCARLLGDDAVALQNLNRRNTGNENNSVTPGINEPLQDRLAIIRQRVEVSNQIGSALQLAPDKSNATKNSGNRREQ